MVRFIVCFLKFLVTPDGRAFRDPGDEAVRGLVKIGETGTRAPAALGRPVDHP